MSVADIRRSYDRCALDESRLADDPIRQLDAWVNDALHAELPDATAMTLATADAQGRPSARIVLLKHYDEQGLVFYTNYESRKGQDLAANPQACLSFYWSALERQIRVEGKVRKTSAAESDAYFASRPLASRLSAWASPQSRPTTRQELESRLASYTASLGDDPARPEFWGGYRLVPDTIEFWQGRGLRLHDRVVYARSAAGPWQRSRLAP